MDWRATVRETMVAVLASFVVAAGVSYTQLIRLDERVLQQDERAILRNAQLTQEMAHLRSEQTELRRQMLRVMENSWSNRHPTTTGVPDWPNGLVPFSRPDTAPISSP